MDELCFRDVSSDGAVTTIVSILSQVSGVGFGEPDNRIRAKAEALERFWQKRGPSRRARVYSMGQGTANEVLTLASNTLPTPVDSSGTAIHRSLGQAVEAACREFIERQSIISHWRFGTSATGLGSSRVVDPGDCRLREISIFSGIYVVLALFHRAPEENSVVEYAAGASCSSNLKEAINQAVRECKQAYLAMQDNIFRNATNRPLMDEIQKKYHNANSLSTVNLWPAVSSYMFNDALVPQLDCTGLDILQRISDPPLLLLDSLFYDGEPWYVARLMSDRWPASLHDNRESALKNIRNMVSMNSGRIDPVPFG